MKKPELLSPAGSFEALKAAVQNGADAVYLGGKRFGARAYSDNFDRDQMAEAISYCHLYGVKVDVTLNTLLYADELNEAVEYAAFLYACGVDAVLVQDLGLADQLRKRLPDLALHASTQMHIHNKAGLELVRSMGFSRAVLARETPLEKVKELSKDAGIETEIFVNGALCVCASGQCYLSLDHGDRSGNRGQCAQPCRLPYRLICDGKSVPTEGRYLLSPRDLYTLDHIPELMESGASCFKIEGRMKRPEYVGFITSQYRQAIDAYCNNRVFFPDVEGAKKLFNRGFTTGHLFNQRGPELMNPVRPNHIGIPLGTVLSCRKNKIRVRLDHDLHQVDGVRILNEKGDSGFIVNYIEINGKLVNSALAGTQADLVNDASAKPGDPVVLTTDKAFMEELARTDSRSSRHEKVALTVDAREGSVPVLSASYHGITVKTEGEQALQKASKKPFTEEQWKQALSRTLDTPFVFDPIAFHTDPDLFVPVSVVNNLRRDLVNQLIMEISRKKEGNLLPATYQKAEKEPQERLIISVRTREQYNVAKEYSDLIFTDNLSLQKEEGLGYILPRYNEDLDLSGFSKILVNEPGQLELDASFKMTSLYFNTANPEAIRFLEEKGADTVEISREINFEKLSELITRYKQHYDCLPDLTVLVYGRRDLMITKACLPNTYQTEDHKKHCGLCKQHVYGLRSDDRNYPLWFDPYCYMHIEEEKPSVLISDLNSLKKSGVKSFRIHFTEESEVEARQILEFFHSENVKS